MSTAARLPTPAELERVLVDALFHEPDSELIDRPDWVQLRTPSSRWPNHNKVLLAQIEPGQEPRVVAEVIAEHRDRGARLQWSVGPSSSPSNLGQHIESAGIALLSRALGMVLPVPQHPLPGLDDLVVQEVGLQDVQTFARLSAQAWQQGDAFRDAVAHIVTLGLREPQLGARCWIAHYKGEAVATCNLRVVSQLGYFQGCAVKPAYRGRGLYQALLNYRLSVLRELGETMAVVWADAATSAGACKKLGFRTVCSAALYQSAG